MSNFIFQDEIEDEINDKPHKTDKFWRILVIDDDESVHQVTKLVLADAEIEHRKLQIVSAFSSKQAKEIMLNDNSFCMAFVDVVMETDHAGLELVEWIRKDLKNQAIRLVLRTGQAGSAPEAKVIKEFDINDYKEKTDFTANKMITTVYASIRAYRDIMTIQRSLDAFKKLIATTHDLLKINQLKNFGSAALAHLLTLMNVESSALYIARTQIDFAKKSTSSIIACTGKYVCESDSLESSNIDKQVKARIQQVFIDKNHYRDESCFVGYYQASSHSASVLYIEFEDDNEHFKASLAELFATNVALVFESITKQQEIEKTQRELLFIVGEAVEARSKETGAHVRRVAIICEILATKFGLEKSFVEAIRLAAPLHDLGKIAIPEHILHNPGKLEGKDWEIMKSHAQIGADMLEKSTVSISKLAARLANYHHENWDGSGYPKGLKGEDIPVEARIMAVADVFDALGSKRCYKEPWSAEKIKEFLLSQSGIKFEAKLVNIMVEDFDEFLQVRLDYPDYADPEH
ncbi:HD domain-containing phosphohydrolase [Colwellia sp. TT2012]|uniref:HD domain-containing phosphohydrolase n=1 Tax=Colwellia sp. TT2012 TaxID=1720342 RepID=UPI00070ACB07|nr:HD domain-containing phosphohydrolase [Colwellia sp. TT2012]